MDLYLSPQAFAAVRGQDLILLDAVAGDYLLLPGAGQGVSTSATGNRLTGASRPLAEALAELGAVGDRPLSRPQIPEPPTLDIGLDPGPWPSGADLIAWLGAGADMARRYGRHAFGELVAWQGEAPPGARDAPRLLSAARTFRRLLPWVPLQGECLFRALMLRAFLRRRGLAATWVVGCQTWPFEAHCWLQSGPLVLDDTADHAAGFTPLLAL